jgi:hypothetical protein
MLFWQRLSLVLLAPTMSGTKDGQRLGHSRFRIYKGTRRGEDRSHLFIASRTCTKTTFNLFR